MTNQARTFSLPPDLGAQIGRDKLARLVRQIAGDCAAQLAPDLPRDDPTSTASGCALLGLLTYCYASGVLSSRALTEMAEADPVARTFCGDAIPDRDEIASFRRDHRTLIQECLKQVYMAAWQVMVQEAGQERVSGGNAGTQRQPIPSAPYDPDDLLRQISARISQAAQMDCWSSDW
jgi:hypothetical protein